MGHYQVAQRQQQILRNIALDVHMGRLLAELQWVPVPAYSKNQVDRFLSKPFQDSREDVGPLIKESAQGGIHGRPPFDLPMGPLL